MFALGFELITGSRETACFGTDLGTEAIESERLAERRTARFGS